MKKFILMASLIAVVVAALALPALAQDRFSNHPHQDRSANSWNPFEQNAWWNNNGNNWWDNHNNNDNRNNNNGNNDVPAVSQSNEQQVQSGDSTQTFNVTGGGDNSNSCQGIQGISNTGNAVNNTGVLQYGSDGNVEVQDSGNFTISPSSSTTCNQKVDQAASASGW